MAGDVETAAPRLAVSGLEKRFRSTQAVAGLDFAVGAGELLGLIGPNGAGKSTTIKIITGQLLPDAGSVRVDGKEIGDAPLEARQLIGYVPQDVHLYPFLTGRELLEFVAEVRGVDRSEIGPRVDELLERFHLAEAQHRMTREYSEGMARKLAIAAALVGEPALLVLDESLTGLDPRAVAEVKTAVAAQLERGVAVVLVSHLLDAIERLCTRVLLMDRGKAVGTLDRAQLDSMVSSGATLESYFLSNTGH